jgi:phasin family protein
MAKSNQNKQLEAVIAPVVEFNKLVLSNAEAAFNLQMASIQAYTQMGLKNLSAGFEVKNPEDFKAYAENQKAVAQEVTAQVTADVKALGEMNAKFIESAKSLAEQNVNNVVTAKAA